MIRRHKVLNIIAAIFAIAVISGKAEAATYINQAALTAVEMQETLVYKLQQYVEFMRVCLAYISPSPETARSMIKGSNSQNRFAKLFSELDHNQKSQEQNSELWKDLLEKDESKAISMIQYAIEPFGQEIFGDRFPTQSVPFASRNSKFRFGISSLRYIIPAHSGIIIASPEEVDKSIREYLLSSALFYPIVTIEIPVAKEVRENYFYEEICAGVIRKVPEAYFSQNSIYLTIFPTTDKIHSMIQTIRQSMYMGI